MLLATDMYRYRISGCRSSHVVWSMATCVWSVTFPNMFDLSDAVVPDWITAIRVCTHAHLKHRTAARELEECCERIARNTYTASTLSVDSIQKRQDTVALHVGVIWGYRLVWSLRWQEESKRWRETWREGERERTERETQRYGWHHSWNWLSTVVGLNSNLHRVTALTVMNRLTSRCQHRPCSDT